MIPGIDRSQWDALPNPTVELQQGARFMITKAGQGGVEDSSFRQNMTIYKGKMARGTFYLIDSHDDPKRQAEHYWSLIEPDPGEISILWVDFEKPDIGMTDAEYFKTQYSGWHALYDFIERLKVISGHVVGIYSNWDMFHIAGPTDPAQRAYFEALPFWDSHPGASPLLPDGFTHYVLWQREFAGINGLDTDIFNGTEEDFAAFISSPSPIPGPAPAPSPIPAPPAPIVAGLGLFYLCTREEYNAKVPADKSLPASGSFAQIGGEGQNNWVGLGQKESDFIESIGQNRSLFPSWALHDRGTVYIGSTPSDIQWPVILAASITGQPRNMVKVLARSPGRIKIDSIPNSLEYSNFNPQAQPYLFGNLGTIYKDGHDGPGVHNGLPFVMPYFDPSTFQGPAGHGADSDGLWISEAVLFGPVATKQAIVSLTLTIIADPALMIRTYPDVGAPAIGARMKGEKFILDGIGEDFNGRLWGHDSRGWSALGSQAVYVR